MGIVRFALRFPHTFYVLAALILFLGIAAIRSMPTDIFPEIRIPVVTVIWQYTGLTTPEMEQRVSTYSQYSISANVNGIKNMEAQGGRHPQRPLFADVRRIRAWVRAPARWIFETPDHTASAPRHRA